MKRIVSACGIIVLFLLSVPNLMITSKEGNFHSGTLVIDGEEYVIENTTFVQYGDIIVRNGGRLVIRNATLQFRIDYHEQYSIQIEDNSEIVIKNADVYPVGDGDVFGILFRNSSRGYIINMSQGEKNFGTTIVVETGSPNISIENSQLTTIEISDRVKYAIVNVTNSQIESFGLWIHDGILEGLTVGYIHDTTIYFTNFRVHLLNVSITKEIIIWTAGNSEIWIYNSKISQIDVRESSRVYLINSTVGGVIPFLSDREFGANADVSLTLHSGFYKNYTLNFTQIGGWCITLINTCVGCPPVDYLPPGGWYVKIGPGVKVRIFNSEIDRLRFSTFHGNATVYVKDSVIRWFEFWDFNGVVTLDNVTITEWFSVYKEPDIPQRALIRGNVTIVPKTLQFMFGLKWFDSIIQREYPIVVKKGQFYTAYNNFSLKIADPSGKLINSFPVDPSKTYYPILTYDKTNYEKAFSLKVYGDGFLLGELPITLLTSTPIEITLGDILPRDVITAAPLIYGNGRVDIEYAKGIWKTMYSDNNYSKLSAKLVVLIGGPLANNVTKKYMQHFPINITNEYPGRGKGVIGTAIVGDKIYVLLAGSDRWGTKAAVEIFKGLKTLDNRPIFVDWNNGNPQIVKG